MKENRPDKKVSLRDGSEIKIRSIRVDDLDRLFDFFESLPEEDRGYLRFDVTNRRNVERMLRGCVAWEDRKRLVALENDGIIATGLLERTDLGWKQHMAEIRLIVARGFQRRGVGMVMARELYALASEARIESIVVRMMAPQVGARNIFKKLGFKEEVTLPHYVKDLWGRKQDLVVMHCDLTALWQKMEDLLAASDWQRAR